MHRMPPQYEHRRRCMHALVQLYYYSYRYRSQYWYRHWYRSTSTGTVIYSTGTVFYVYCYSILLVL